MQFREVSLEDNYCKCGAMLSDHRGKRPVLASADRQGKPSCARAARAARGTRPDKAQVERFCF